VVLYLLKTSCFRAINENGDLVAITRSEEDGLFHVLGDLDVTPFSLLRNSLLELDRLIAACGNRHILILGALPRFFLKTCCDNLSNCASSCLEMFAHCANISRHDETQVEAGKKFMQDLEDLNSQLAVRLNSRNVQFVFTGDVISGKNRCSIGDLADCLFMCWRSDPVHGDRSAYMKIAVGILDFLNPPPRNTGNDSGPAQRKRSREDSSPTQSCSMDRDRSGRDRERHPHERREDQRSRSAYNSYPSRFRGGRGRGGGGGNRRFF
jgi:hypothetical protein